MANRARTHFARRLYRADSNFRYGYHETPRNSWVAKPIQAPEEPAHVLLRDCRDPHKVGILIGFLKEQGISSEATNEELVDKLPGKAVKIEMDGRNMVFIAAPGCKFLATAEDIVMARAKFALGIVGK